MSMFKVDCEGSVSLPFFIRPLCRTLAGNFGREFRTYFRHLLYKVNEKIRTRMARATEQSFSLRPGNENESVREE